MQLTATALLLAAVPAAAARGTDGLRALQTPETLPEINDLINIAFPMWEVDENGNRLEVKPCTVNSCEWNPYYITKRYDGLHPDLGGHPTDIDVGYAYFAGSPFAGQPYPGTPHHCPEDAPDDIKAGDCPKIETLTDADGAGHVPPHIALASLTWAVRDNLFSLEEMFANECRVHPFILLQMIRTYYPRTEGQKVSYPPPIVPEGGDYQYEFPSGNGLANQGPPYAPGPPHWCTEEMLATGHWDGVCPYVFEGPDAGKYRHPHIAFAALEVFLANRVNPRECRATWLQNNPDFLNPARGTTDTPFPLMDRDYAPPNTVENWLGQPVLPWDYDSGEPRPTAGSLPAKLPPLPEINDLINIAFPMWEVDENGNRLEVKPCTVNSCEWNPYYITKRYDGLHPDLGGHPTDIDVGYAYFAGSPFAGQPYPGTPHHCPEDAPDDIKAGDCPKIETLTDEGPDGPGHVPPHIALASLTWAVQQSRFSLEEMFANECRVAPDVLLQMIRTYYPRTEGQKVSYPPPIVPEGGDYQYEFPSGNGLANQGPPYAPGPPHWCTEEMLATGHWDGVCPYVFEGPDAGKYRHPHIAFAALEVFLANRVNPRECRATWLQNNPDFLNPARGTTDTPFPLMDRDYAPPNTVENWLGQPVLPWDYDSGDARYDDSSAPDPNPGVVVPVEEDFPTPDPTPGIVDLSEPPKRAFLERNVQISTPLPDGGMACWSLAGPASAGTGLVLADCSPTDPAQRFDAENYASGEARWGRPDWDAFYAGASVAGTCLFCDVGGMAVLRPRGNPQVAVTAVGFALQLEKATNRRLDPETQAFVNLEWGAVLVGSGNCDILVDCLEASARKVGGPIRLRKTSKLYVENPDDDGVSPVKPQVLHGWEIFGS